MSQLVLGGGTVDLQTGAVSTRLGTLALTDLELRLLQYLLAHTDRTISREELLERVWGYAPGVHSRTVDTTIQRLRTKIEADPAQPAHLHTVRGSGYRLELPAEPAPQARPLGTIPRLEHLLGREGELRALRALLQRGATRITLTGPSGIGKTWLARRALTELCDAGRTSTWFTSLEGATPPQDLLHALADTLGIAQGDGDPAAAIVRRLSETPSTGVLDDLQGLDNEALALLAKILRQVPQLVVIVTSQRLLGLEGEHRLEVPPLDLSQSVGVLRDRLGALGLPLPSPSELERLAARAQGLPLALELLCPLLEVLPLARLLALPDLLALESDRPDLPERHRSLRAAVQASLALLDPPDLAVLMQLSVFAGAFTLEAAEAIVLVPADQSLLATLTVLSRRSLLRRLPEQRMVLDSPVRAQLRAQIEPAKFAAVRDRHARWLAKIQSIRALIPWKLDLQEALQQGPARKVGRLADLLAALVDWLGPIDAMPAVFLRALERELPGDVRAALYRSLAWAHLVNGRPEQADEAASQGLRFAEAAGVHVLVVGLLVERTRAASEAKRHADAVRFAEEAVTRAEALGDGVPLHLALEALAMAHALGRRLDLAVPLHQRAAEIALATAEPTNAASSLMHAACWLDDPARAVVLLREVLALLEGQQRWRREGVVWGHLADRLAEQGLREQAQEAHARAHELLQRAGDTISMWVVEMEHACRIVTWGREQEGLSRLRQAREALRSRVPSQAARASVYLALLTRDLESLRGFREDWLAATALALLEGTTPPSEAAERDIRLLRELIESS